MKARRFDFYPDDWLAGTKELDAAETGVYITACALIYSRGGPIKPEALRAFCPGDLRVYRRSLDRLLELGKLELKRGYLTNKRCISELQLACKRVASAVKNARKRWEKHNKNNAISVQTHMLPSPSSSPSSSPEEGSEAPQQDFKVNGKEHPVVQRCALPAAAPKPEGVRRNIKAQLVQKLMRYCNDRLSGEERTRANLGLMGEDPDHDGQWWIDALDRRRRREGWDDTRDRQYLGAAE